MVEMVAFEVEAGQEEMVVELEFLVLPAVRTVESPVAWMVESLVETALPRLAIAMEHPCPSRYQRCH